MRRVNDDLKFVSASLVSNLKFKKNPHTCTYNLLDEQPNLIYFFKPRNSLHIIGFYSNILPNLYESHRDLSDI